MILTTQKILVPLFVSVLTLSAFAESPNQRGYHLTNPVPKDQMRPLSADRPDATESTQTVDAGHVQLEIDIALYLRERSPSAEDALVFGATNFKLGITHNIDVHLIWAPYARTKVRGEAGTVRDEGVTNLTLRTKINLWGNDGDTETSLALLPFVTIPLGGESVESDDWEGGLVIPFAMDLPCGWGFGAQVGFEIVRNDADDGNRLDVTQAIVFGHDLVGSLAGFVEFASTFPSEGKWAGTLDLGLTYAVNENIQLDVAVFLGVNREAEDFVTFVGMTWRF